MGDCTIENKKCEHTDGLVCIKKDRTSLRWGKFDCPLKSGDGERYTPAGIFPVRHRKSLINRADIVLEDEIQHEYVTGREVIDGKLVLTSKPIQKIGWIDIKKEIPGSSEEMIYVLDDENVVYTMNLAKTSQEIVRIVSEFGVKCWMPQDWMGKLPKL